MTYISNSLTKKNVGPVLDELCIKRGLWENGTYAQSNTELYSILDACFTLFQEAKGKRSLIKEINNLLTVGGIVYNDGTSLATKVVRYVFGSDSKRVFSYARVLIVADLEKTEKESFVGFITRKGGVEEIRKQPDGEVTKAEQMKQTVEIAEQYFISAEALISDFACASPQVHPDAEADHQFTAALLRKNDDGSFSMVFGSNKKTVVKVLLAEGGVVAKPLIAQRALEDQQREIRALRDVLIIQPQAA